MTSLPSVGAGCSELSMLSGNITAGQGMAAFNICCSVVPATRYRAALQFTVAAVVSNATAISRPSDGGVTAARVTSDYRSARLFVRWDAPRYGVSGNVGFAVTLLAGGGRCQGLWLLVCGDCATRVCVCVCHAVSLPLSNTGDHRRSYRQCHQQAMPLLHTTSTTANQQPANQQPANQQSASTTANQQQPAIIHIGHQRQSHRRSQSIQHRYFSDQRARLWRQRCDNDDHHWRLP